MSDHEETASEQAGPTQAGSTESGPSGEQLASAAAALFAGRIATVLLAWTLEIVLVKLVSPGQWDLLSRFLTIGLTGSLLLQFGLPESVLYFVSREGRNIDAVHLLTRSVGILALVGLAIAGTLYIFPSVGQTLLGDGGQTRLLPLLLLLVTELANVVLQSALVAWKRARLSALLSVFSKIAIGLGLVVALATGYPLEASLYAAAIGSAVALLGTIAVTARTIAELDLNRETRVPLRHQLRFSVPLGLARLASTGNVQIDKYIVMSVLATPTVYGIYYLGAAEIPIPSHLSAAVMTVSMGYLVTLYERHDVAGTIALWHSTVRKLSLIAFPFCLFSIVFAEQGFVAVYGPAYAEAAVPFRIFQLLILHRVTNYGILMQALGRPRVPLIAAIIALTINAPLCYFFLGWFGLIGPPLATFIATQISAVYTLAQVKDALRLRWSSLLPWRHLGRALLTAGVPLVAASVVFLWPTTAALRCLVGLGIYAVLYVPLAVRVGVLKREDLMAFARVLRPRKARHAPGVGP